MKLLLDANISWRLSEKLKPYFDNCFHVDHIGLIIPATDTEIWNYALSNNLIIVTNDIDFVNLASDKGFPPKVVLLRTDNQSNNYLASVIIKHRNDIEVFLKSTEHGFLEIF